MTKRFCDFLRERNSGRPTAWAIANQDATKTNVSKKDQLDGPLLVCGIPISPSFCFRASGHVLYWLTWEFEGFIKPRKQQRPLETCKIHYFFLDLFWVCPLLSINSLQKKKTPTTMKQNTVISRKRARKINTCNLKILEQILMDSVAKRQTTTETSLGKVLAFSSHFMA